MTKLRNDDAQLLGAFVARERDYWEGPGGMSSTTDPREHVTDDGAECWCDPETIIVSPRSATVEGVLLARILFIGGPGEGIPVLRDDVSKFVLSGTPQEFMDAVLAALRKEAEQ